MDWFDLHAFITIAREKSISKASQSLHVTQPTLTSRIKKLEQELGVGLLERNWKGVELTPYGRLFFTRAIKIIKEMNSVITLFNKINLLGPDNPAGEQGPHEFYNHGKLKIGLSKPLCSSFFTPIIMEMARSYPDLRCDIISEVPEYIFDLVSVGEIHIGIVPCTETRPDLKSLPIFNEEMILIGPKHDPNPIRKDLKNAALLLQKPFIFFTSHSPLRKLSDRVLIELVGEIPMDIQEVNDLNVMISMISNGLGYTILPTSFVLPVESSNDTAPYQILKLGPRFPARMIHMVYSASSQCNFAIDDIAKTISSPYKTMLGAL